MRISAGFLVGLLLVLALTSCAPQHDNSRETNAPRADCPLLLPATYAADIPCRNCLPTTALLTLRPDFLYFLRVVTTNPETGKEVIKAEIGTWYYIAADKTILLASYDHVARTLFITPDQNLRVVKVAGGGVIPPDVNYDLIRDDTNPGYYDLVRLKGMYTLESGIGRFSECLSGAEFPVAPEGENAALERAYMNTPHGYAEPMLVTLDGRIAFRMNSETANPGDILVPVRFIRIQPGVRCSGEKSSRLRLVDNSWRLMDMNGTPLNLKQGQRNPFISLETRDNRIHGFAGCNRFSGTYLVKGEIFLFNKMISTRMACVDGMVMEDEFFRVLSATEGYRIEGDILELRDHSGKVLARLRHAGGM